jgi:hypothetical protein
MEGFAVSLEKITFVKWVAPSTIRAVPRGREGSKE